LSNLHHKSDPPWHTWAIWPPQNHWLTSTEHIKRWWSGWTWNWWELWISYEHGIDGSCGYHLVGFFGLEVGQIKADFCQTSTTNLTQNDTHGQYDHPKTINYNIIWTYQEMMEWMNMELMGAVDIIW
jgi:hypothetical protein